MKYPRCVFCVGLIASVVLAAPTFAAEKQKGGRRAETPAPTLSNVKYGPHERNILDFWRADTKEPAPLVLFIHGGGFRRGSKEQISPVFLQGLLAKGISVMSINYRLSPEVSFPAHYQDCARAIQFARLNAPAWHIDPARVGSSGGSAGAGTSLWIGFHDEMADPKNADPVLRQSTRLQCIAVRNAQSTYDPRVIREWVGPSAADAAPLAAFFGVKPDEADTPRAYRIYEEASAINYLTRDDPPVYASYYEAGEIPANAKAGTGIHHVNFGLRLKERMEALGLECVVRHRDEGADPEREMVEYFARHLLGETRKTSGH